MVGTSWCKTIQTWWHIRQRTGLKCDRVGETKMLSIRKRGEVYYVRGTVRVGNKTFTVKEHSSGFCKLKDAREYASKLEQDTRDSVLNPNADKTKKTLFNDCLVNYLNKKRPTEVEFVRIRIIAKHFDGVPVSEMTDKWNEFCKERQNLAVSTLNRYISTLNAIMNMAKEDLNITPPKIKKQPVKNTVVFVLQDDVRDKLLSCYSDHVRPIFILLAYQGFREQECLQLLWEDINLKDKTIMIRKSKNGETRIAPMHNKVWWTLARHWIRKGKPTQGHVWLRRDGTPYPDSRKHLCGTPLASAQRNALKKLKSKYGITLKMRVHDWRHNFASQLVMAGVDLLTIQELGGWKSLEMVKRYATFSNKHKVDSINKI